MNSTKNITLTQTKTYYVICNKVLINAQNLNPTLGSSDMLTVNNTQFYSPNKYATYQ
ncbi:hypothetical protein IKS57_03680 [bacterium]|nr:hypothetical protein [bacterium]